MWLHFGWLKNFKKNKGRTSVILGVWAASGGRLDSNNDRVPTLNKLKNPLPTNRHAKGPCDPSTSKHTGAAERRRRKTPRGNSSFIFLSFCTRPQKQRMGLTIGLRG
jgi:hypothetical protein